MLKLSTLALCCASLMAPVQGAPQMDGRLVLVARESIEDAGLRAQLAAIGGTDAQRFVLALSSEESLPGVDRCIERESLEDANDRELAIAVRDADVLVVRGGSFMGWYKTTFHERGRTLLADALLDRVRERKTVIAYGGAAAYYCAGTTIPRTEIERTTRNPRYAHTQVASAAMRLGPSALFDSDDWPQGSVLRWVHSLGQTRMNLGFYLVGDVALDYSRDSRMATIMGPGYVLACDLHKARRKKRSLEELRLSKLLAGDGWDFNHKRATRAKPLVHLNPHGMSRRLVPHSLHVTSESPATELGARLLAGPNRAQGLPRGGEAALFEFTPDVLTEIWVSRTKSHPGATESVPARETLLSVPLRVEWADTLFEPADESQETR